MTASLRWIWRIRPYPLWDFDSSNLSRLPMSAVGCSSWKCFDHLPLLYALANWTRYQTATPTRAVSTRFMQPNTISDFALPGPIRKAATSWKTAGSRNASQETVISFSVLKLHHTAEHDAKSNTQVQINFNANTILVSLLFSLIIHEF